MIRRQHPATARMDIPPVVKDLELPSTFLLLSILERREKNDRGRPWFGARDRNDRADSGASSTRPAERAACCFPSHSPCSVRQADEGHSGALRQPKVRKSRVLTGVRGRSHPNPLHKGHFAHSCRVESSRMVALAIMRIHSHESTMRRCYHWLMTCLLTAARQCNIRRFSEKAQKGLWATPGVHSPGRPPGHRRAVA